MQIPYVERFTEAEFEADLKHVALLANITEESYNAMQQCRMSMPVIARTVAYNCFLYQVDSDSHMLRSYLLTLETKGFVSFKPTV